MLYQVLEASGMRSSHSGAAAHMALHNLCEREWALDKDVMHACIVRAWLRYRDDVFNVISSTVESRRRYVKELERRIVTCWRSKGAGLGRR